MGKINILNDSGNAKATLEFNGSSDIEVNADNLSGITSDVQGQIDSKVDKISSTDNAIARFDGTTGELQDSGVTVDDNGELYMPDNMSIRWGPAADLVLRRTESNNTIRLGSGQPSDEIQFYAGAAERLRIDSSGRVTMPYQPSFKVFDSRGGERTEYGILPLSYVHENIGGHFNTSTYTFTAPVAGRYMFIWNSYSDSSATVERRIFLRKNGADVIQTGRFGNGVPISSIVYLSANDTVNIGGNVNYPINYYASAAHNEFIGYLLG